MVTHACDPRTGRLKQEEFKLRLGNFDISDLVRPWLKNFFKKAWRSSSVVECLPVTHEALGSIPTLRRKKFRRKVVVMRENF